MESNIGGLQLALFEVIWPAYPWINQIRLIDHPSNPTVCIQASSVQGIDEQEACATSLRELMSLWKPDSLAFVRFQLPNEEVEPSMEVMSSDTFALIASDVAPWRLALGR